MSFTEGCESAAITEFNGARPVLDSTDLLPGTALTSLNCQYVPGKVITREGFTPVVTGAGTSAVSPYYYAYGDPAAAVSHYLAWFDFDVGGGNYTFKARNLGTATTYTVKTGLSVATSGASFASVGKRLYGSPNQGGYPLGGAYVWDGNTTHTMDDCFQRPMKTTEVTLALTQPGAGVATAGTHYVGVLFQTRSGYWTRPGPCDSSIVLQPQSIVSTGVNNIRATLTPASTWPTWIAAVKLIYTSALNNFQYYVVPGTSTSITAGSATVYTIDFSVADLQLRSVGSQGAGTLADDYFSLLSMDGSNVAPFNVKFQLSWGDRIVWFGNYGGVDTFFPSDQLNPEWISADQHAKQLPNGLPIGAAFVLGGVLYVVSSSGGVFGYSDDGGRPVNFSPPRILDSRISCQRADAVTVAASGGYAFVNADQGLFVYSGNTFPQTAMSYYQQTDFITGRTGTVKDFTREQIVLVQQGSGVIYTFNYQAGMTPDKVRASKWTSTLFPSYAGVETVYNPATTSWELWVSANGGFLRQKSTKTSDVALYTDFLSTTAFDPAFGSIYAINWRYQCAPLPENAKGEIFNNLALRVRATTLQASLSVSGISKAAAAVVTVTVAHGMAVGTTLTVTIAGATGPGWSAVNGTFTPTPTSSTAFSIPVVSTGFGTLGGTVTVAINGVLVVAAKSLDDVISVTPATSPQAITASPGQRYLMPYDMQAENASYLLTNGSEYGSGVMVSELEHFYNLFSMER